MAQKMQILYTDDTDGSEAQGTVRFGYVRDRPEQEERGQAG